MGTPEKDLSGLAGSPPRERAPALLGNGINNAGLKSNSAGYINDTTEPNASRSSHVKYPLPAAKVGPILVLVVSASSEHDYMGCVMCQWVSHNLNKLVLYRPEPLP